MTNIVNIDIKRLSTVITVKSLVVEVLGALVNRRWLISLVPEVGIEPTRTQGPLDFESSASTSFTTPAKTKKGIIVKILRGCQYDIDMKKPH